MDFAPITYELWEAFVEERRHWEVVESPSQILATDRKRFTHGPEFVNPMEATTFTAELCSDRQAAHFYIGIRCMQVALEKTGIVHAHA